MERRDILSVAAAALIASLAAGCVAAPASPSPSATPSQSSTPTPLPTPTPPRWIDIDALPKADLDPGTLTAVCDPEPDAGNPDRGELMLSCYDGLVLGLRALHTAVDDPIQRLYLRRPTCTTTPCSEDVRSTATVTGWTKDGATSVQVDSRLETATEPATDPDAVWPEPRSLEPPPVEREAIKDAPGEVAERVPYPFCGRAEHSDPPGVFGCFRDAVLAGRPAEMIERLYGFEGEPILWLFRYSGHGALVRYQRVGNDWLRQDGSMILGVSPLAWDFEPWPGGTEVH